MKRILFIIMVALLTFSCSDDAGGSGGKNSSYILDKDVAGSELTKEFCIGLVRDYWDCNLGANGFMANMYPDRYYSCDVEDKASLIRDINTIFDSGIDPSKSYYKDRILTIYSSTIYDDFYKKYSNATVFF